MRAVKQTSLSRAGFIGKATLQIPFYRPHVDPWVISISGLHLIGAPEKVQDFNDEKEELLERERKKALLQALEEKWKARRGACWPEGQCWGPRVREGPDSNPGCFPCRTSASRKESRTGTQ